MKANGGLAANSFTVIIIFITPLPNVLRTKVDTNAKATFSSGLKSRQVSSIHIKPR